jgi:methylmalonyl-CoA/ethylmalonyl-CoA epimerase
VIGRLHHIGYAVADIREYVDTFLTPLFGDVEVGEIFSDPIQKVRVAFVSVSGGPLIELVEAAADDSPVRKLVGSARGGLYHVCYEVDDMEAAIGHFRKVRCLPLGRPVPAIAFGGRSILFLMTPQRDLIELVESVNAVSTSSTMVSICKSDRDC